MPNNNHNQNFKSVFELNKLLKDNNFFFKKSLGQNFLNNNKIIEKIIKTAAVNNHDFVVEIGAGSGFLTQYLATYAKEVFIFEKDFNLKAILNQVLIDYQNVNLIFEDFLKVNLQEILPMNSLKVIANLPYNVACAILKKISFMYIEGMHIISATTMLQKEVALKLCAKKNDHFYSSISVIYDLFSDVIYNFTIHPGNFTPKPKVDSAVVSIYFNKYKYFQDINDLLLCKLFIKACFKFRRKTLFNNLRQFNKTIDLENFFKNNNLSLQTRAQELTTQEFVNLFLQLKQLNYFEFLKKI